MKNQMKVIEQELQIEMGKTEVVTIPKQTGLWKKIAKNELKIRSSKFRKNRPAFFI